MEDSRKRAADRTIEEDGSDPHDEAKRIKSVLKCLYDTSVDGEAVAEDEGMVGDGEMSAEVFATIQRFITERNKLRGLVDRVQTSKAVQEEAIKFVNQEKEAIASTMTPISPAKTRDGPIPMFPRSSSSVVMASQQSPYAPRFFSSSHRMDQLESSSGSLNLMAALLRRKYLIADKMLKKRTDPFKALLVAVRERVQNIDKLLSSHCKHTVEEEEVQKAPDTIPEETATRLETKHRLWKLLLLDLESSV
eukprot:scaffold1900_cov123-Cylindrotheca_fusiformis.AAC.32